MDAQRIAVDAIVALTDWTAEYAFAISRMICPRLAGTSGPHLSEGAGKTGCALHPRSRVPLRTAKAASRAAAA